MPTAAQWCANTNASRKRVTAWNPGGGGGWSGGAWKKKYSNEEPTKGGFCGLVSKDGRAWTPGPGRYSQGNPNGSSVRYDKLKYSRMPSTVDDQKTRWPSDSCLPVAQHGGVIINPTRGFSMGTGLGPSETVWETARKVGQRTIGPDYLGMAPDLNMGERTATSRGPAPGSLAKAAGGGLPGTRFGPAPTEFPPHSTFTPGPGAYGGDQTYCGIGTLDNPLALLSTHANPRSHSFGIREAWVDEENGHTPGPLDYCPAYGPYATHHRLWTGAMRTSVETYRFPTDPLRDRSESTAESIARNGYYKGPPAYDIGSALNYLSGRPDCEKSAHFRNTGHVFVQQCGPETPAPWDYDWLRSSEGHIRLRTGGLERVPGGRCPASPRFRGDAEITPGPQDFDTQAWLEHWRGPAFSMPHSLRDAGLGEYGPGPEYFPQVTREGDGFTGDERGVFKSFPKEERGQVAGEVGEGAARYYSMPDVKDDPSLDGQHGGWTFPRSPRFRDDEGGHGPGRYYEIQDARDHPLLPRDPAWVYKQQAEKKVPGRGEGGGGGGSPTKKETTRIAW